jgi:hypothetical protein
MGAASAGPSEANRAKASGLKISFKDLKCE